MKPFNLDAARAGAAVITRDGRSARIICTDKLSTDCYSVIALVKGVDSEKLHSYTVKGEHDAGLVGPHDLFMAPVKREGWVNVYKRRDLSPYVGNGVYPSEEDAKAASNHGICYSGTVHIEWEE